MSFLKGALGALLVSAILVAGYWSYARYQDFLVMRSVVAQILEQSQKAQAAQTPAPTK